MRTKRTTREAVIVEVADFWGLYEGFPDPAITEVGIEGLGNGGAHVWVVFRHGEGATYVVNSDPDPRTGAVRFFTIADARDKFVFRAVGVGRKGRRLPVLWTNDFVLGKEVKKVAVSTLHHGPEICGVYREGDKIPYRQGTEVYSLEKVYDLFAVRGRPEIIPVPSM